MELAATLHWQVHEPCKRSCCSSEEKPEEHGTVRMAEDGRKGPTEELEACGDKHPRAALCVLQLGSVAAFMGVHEGHGACHGGARGTWTLTSKVKGSSKYYRKPAVYKRQELVIFRPILEGKEF